MHINNEAAYIWNFRLSNRVDLKVLTLFWSLSIFTIVADFFVYWIFPSYDLYDPEMGGTLMGGVYKAVITAAKLIPISLIVTLLILRDRKVARLNLKDAKVESAKSIPSSTEKKLRRSGRTSIRLAIFIAATIICLPWIFAIVGVYISDIPGLNLIYLGRQPYARENNYPSVHLGEHHGWDGYLFTVMALLSSILLDNRYNLRNQLGRSIIAGGCAFFALYAFFAIPEDFLNEQLIKRGFEVPIHAFFAQAYSSILFYPIVTGIAIGVLLAWNYFDL